MYKKSSYESIIAGQPNRNIAPNILRIEWRGTREAAGRPVASHQYCSNTGEIWWPLWPIGEKHSDAGCVLNWPELLTERKKKEIKKCLQYLWSWRFKYCKDTNFPKLVYRFSTIQPQEILNWQTNSECHSEMPKAQE